MTDHYRDTVGTRTIEIALEVPGTPEAVWDAIATGPGIAAWFVPAVVEPGEGGTLTLAFAEGLEETCEVTVWEPPRRLVYTSGSEDRRLAQEFRVEAHGGGRCVVRFVNSGFGTSADWAAQYDSMSEGWKLFFDNLRLYLTRFAGQPCYSVTTTRTAQGSRNEIWAAVTKALGFPEVPAVGEWVEGLGEGVPTLAGIVERVTPTTVTLLLDRPAPGLGEVMVEGFDGEVFVSVYLYLYGDAGAAVIDRERAAWLTWVDDHYPTRWTPGSSPPTPEPATD